MSQAVEAQIFPRRPARLAVALVEDLVDRIVSGALEPGVALPTEPALCEMYGVSRTVVREAIKSLEQMQLVRAQQGHGTRVRDAADWDLLNPVVLGASVQHDAERSILDDLVIVRQALEAEMAAQATRIADADQRAEINAALDQVVADEADLVEFYRSDLAFHDAIMRVSGNRFGRAVVRAVNEEAFRSQRYIGDPSRADRRQSNREHRAIAEAIGARQPEASAQLMANHIHSSWLKRKPASGRPAKK